MQRRGGPIARGMYSSSVPHGTDARRIASAPRPVQRVGAGIDPRVTGGRTGAERASKFWAIGLAWLLTQRTERAILAIVLWWHVLLSRHSLNEVIGFMGKFLRFPATDLPGIAGFVLMVVVSIAIAKRLPIIKKAL